MANRVYILSHDHVHMIMYVSMSMNTSLNSYMQHVCMERNVGSHLYLANNVCVVRRVFVIKLVLTAKHWQNHV